MAETTKNSIKALVGRRMAKKFTFMGEDVVINKLSYAQVDEIRLRSQRLAEEAKVEVEGETVESKDANNEGFELIKTVIRFSVTGGDELSDEDFLEFPLDELTKLSNEIMKYSGLGDQGK